MLTALLRLGIEAFLLSGFLAGLKRSTGITPAVAKIPNKDLRQIAVVYLEMGEYGLDFAQVFFGRSRFFVREYPQRPGQ